MTAMPQAGLRDAQTPKGGDVLLSEDWVSPEAADPTLRKSRGWLGLVSLNRSPLARKIIIFNLMALLVLVAGVLFLNPFRDSLVVQREQAFVTEAQLVADVFEARLPAEGVVDMGADSRFARSIGDISLSSGTSIFVIDKDGRVVGSATGAIKVPVNGQKQSTLITDFLNGVWENASNLVSSGGGRGAAINPESLARALFERAMAGQTAVNLGTGAQGGALFSVVSPVERAGEVLAVVALISAEGEIDALVRNEREQILQMFLVALLVSIGLSLVLASTIANPLSDLAAAAELGHDRDARKMQPGRIRIPDLAGRPDEIGRLSVALRGMVAALYDRIDANEQFAADVAHEIKNPLASLRSAVASLHMAKRDDHRTRLLEVIDHDVRRLDRLVSDISNASRLDSELVKEEEETFNLTKTLTNLCEYLGQQAGEKGVELITDFPADPILISGLEARLAQVFVNLITNAVSFCDEGDAVRVWTRKRDNRVLVVVEDTGPGIPEQALTKVFKRFYSERPQGQFGNNSGLGLSISKQIVEAHGGVIWAENIRPTNADATSDPLGARFIVGLPV
ncbi:MAG: sensor histidine kinase [Pseudotabrizicola sp.]|uniref:sensor histidine kinase n=1 Tax=Pseudotabrizicola sp. TaxID=2939647 RepID=UPI002717ECA7|nr:sensor histidine kinase [Pseudotabrizicola sp.]MDO9639527.1 sensor histidine kinase [Pseudotabrizicola sp.]